MGDKFGPYTILSAIRAGGMGEVYKARDTRLDRTVAIKVLPEHIAKREEVRARFEREARAVASLNHPNICTLHDIGPGSMVMELIEGETLAARIEKGVLPLDPAMQLETQIADALDRAHRAGVTHRDIKPQNIMLSRDGVKVLDFGLAKSGAKPGPTEGTVMGTPQYMAPEQFEGKEADARSDIWAFGAGAVGMCAVMAARVAGCTTIIAVDTKDNRLRLAQELGATHAINAAVTDPVQDIQGITRGGVNYSFESTEVTKVIRQAVDALRPLGVCGMVGQVPPGEEVSLDPWTILLGRTLRGIIQGDAIPQILIPQIVELYLQGRFPIDRLINYYPLEEINEAAADSEQGAVIKAVLRPNES
ncbi:MAG: protein kinase [Bryobacteraceae bacterium]|nr:protein kinase [Bryobacteraceae bacterium]